MLQSFRAKAALILSLLTTIAMALLLLAIAAPYKLLIDWWASRLGSPNPIRYYPWLHGNLVYHAFYRLVAGFKPLEIEAPRVEIRDNELVLVIANHFSNMGYVMWACTMTLTISRRWVWVARHNLHPLWRVPLWFVDLLLLIDRDNRESALSGMEKQVAKFAHHSNVFVIYPDEQRPNHERIAADKRKFERSLGIPLPWLTETKLFKAGGTRQLYRLLRATGRPVRLFVMESGLYVLDNGYSDINKMFGGTFFARVKEIPPEAVPDPDNEDKWKFFMLELCEQANLFLAKRRRDTEDAPSAYSGVRSAHG